MKSFFKKIQQKTYRTEKRYVKNMIIDSASRGWYYVKLDVGRHIKNAKLLKELTEQGFKINDSKSLIDWE